MITASVCRGVARLLSLFFCLEEVEEEFLRFGWEKNSLGYWYSMTVVCRCSVVFEIWGMSGWIFIRIFNGLI